MRIEPIGTDDIAKREGREKKIKGTRTEPWSMLRQKLKAIDEDLSKEARE